MSEESAQMTEPEKAEATITANEENHNEGLELDSLFDEEVAESALMGDEDTTDEKAAESEPEGEQPHKESKTEEKPEKEATPEKKDEKEDEKKPDYKSPPPQGYVPLPALHEARQELKDVKEQLENANQMIATLQSSKPEQKAEPDEFKDFKVLSDAELEELTEDDVEEAILYMNKLQKFKDYQSERKQREQYEAQQRRQIDSAIEKSISRISSEVPGIYDEGSTLGSDLYQFALDNGFNAQYLDILTAPGTRVTPLDKNGNPLNQSYPLADGAASLISMIHKMYQSSKADNAEKVRSEIEAEIRKDEREKATQQLLEKFKNETTGQTFSSIADAPGGSDDEPGRKKFYTEADFAKMSEKEQRAILGG